MFKHNFLSFPQCERIDTDDGRYYYTPAGKFKSVTTLLGERLDKTALKNWQKRMGEENAEKVKIQAGKRGTSIHSLSESYLLNKSDWKLGAMPFNLATFNSIKPILDQNIDEVYGIEAMLYSAKLKAAGTCDLLAVFNGVNTIVDFKTSKRLKKEEDIESYFLQATAYSWCAEELTGIKFPQIAIIMAVDHENPLIFVKNAKNYHSRLFEIFY